MPDIEFDHVVVVGQSGVSAEAGTGDATRRITHTQITTVEEAQRYADAVLAGIEP